MDDEDLAPRLRNRADEITHEPVALDAPDPDPVLDRHRQVDGITHGGDTVRNPGGLGHQAGAESALLHPLARAAAVQVDLVVTEAGGDARGRGELGGFAAAELQRHGMLGRVEAEHPLPVAEQHGLGREHLGIKARMPAEQPVEVPAMPVGQVDHRGDAEPMSRNRGHRRILFQASGTTSTATSLACSPAAMITPSIGATSA